MKKIFYMILLLAIAACNSKPSNFERVILQADSLMDANQDSAKVSLKMLDEIKPQYSQMKKAEQMHYQLTYAKAMNKAFVDFTTDSVMKQVVSYYEQKGSCNEKMLAYYLLGCAYRDLNDDPASLEAYMDATEVADTLNTQCNKQLLARIYAQMGNLFLQQLMPLNAKDANEKSEKYAWMAKDTLTALIAKEHQALVYEQMRDYQKVIDICNETRKLYLKYGYQDCAARILGVPILSLIHLKKYSLAKQYMDSYKKESGYFGDERYSYVNYSMYYYGMARYYLNLKSDSAAYFLTKADACPYNLSSRQQCAYGWFLYYSQRLQADSIAKYATLSVALNDSISKARDRQMVQAIISINSHAQMMNQLDAARYDKNRNLLLCVFAVVVILGGALYIKVYRQKMRRERFIRNRQITFVNQQIISKTEEIRESRKKLFYLKKQNNKYTDEIASKEAQIVALESELEEMKQAFNLSVLKQENEDQNEAQAEAASFVRMKQLAEQQSQPTDEQWQNLELVFNEKFPKFRSNLEVYKPLKEKEYQICILIKLNFSIKELQVLMGMTASGISNIRKRIGMKIFGKDIDTFVIDEFIRNTD